MRKIIHQIAFETDDAGNSTLHALCDDGSIWFLHTPYEGPIRWQLWELPRIPTNEDLMAKSKGEDLP